MTSVKLSERMSAIAGMVTVGNRLADVGCDHAFIPIELCRTGRIPSAIAMDVREGPLERAKAHIADSGWDDRIETRLSDGLEQLGEDEADTILIAGMGGLLIKRILTEHSVPESVVELILQPQSEVAEVRRCIRGIGFVIVDEDMVLEEGKFYPMMKAHRAEEPDGAEPEADSFAQEMEDAFGPILLAKRHPVLHKWLERELDVTDGILDHLKSEISSSPDARHLTERADELEHERKLLCAALEYELRR